MFSVYIGCLAFGAIYAVLSAILGNIGGVMHFDTGSASHGGLDGLHGIGHGVGNGVGHGLDHGFDHAGSGGTHATSQNADTGSDSPPVNIGSEHGTSNKNNSKKDMDIAAMKPVKPHGPSPFNPFVIASAITGFGAFGIIGNSAVSFPEPFCAGFSAACAFLLALVIYFGVVRVMYFSQSNSMYSIETLSGTVAEVIIPLPENGCGEIVYYSGGSRHNCPARSLDGVKINQGDKVIIVNNEKNVMLVSKAIIFNDAAESHSALDGNLAEGSCSLDNDAAKRDKDINSKG